MVSNLIYWRQKVLRVFSIIIASKDNRIDVLTPSAIGNLWYWYIRGLQTSGATIITRERFKPGIYPSKVFGRHRRQVTPLLFLRPVRWLYRWWITWVAKREVHSPYITEFLVLDMAGRFNTTAKLCTTIRKICPVCSVHLDILGRGSYQLHLNGFINTILCSCKCCFTWFLLNSHLWQPGTLHTKMGR
jgi:hypothetical protein